MNKQNFNISALNLAIFCQNLPSAEAPLMIHICYPQAHLRCAPMLFT